MLCVLLTRVCHAEECHERRAELLQQAAAVGMTEDELRSSTEAYIKGVIEGAPAAEPKDLKAWLVRLAELYELEDVDRAVRTAIHEALLADYERPYVPVAARKLNKRELELIEALHVGISAPTRAAHKASPAHAAAHAEMIAKRLEGARARVLTRAAMLLYARRRVQLRAGFKCVRCVCVVACFYGAVPCLTLPLRWLARPAGRTRGHGRGGRN